MEQYHRRIILQNLVKLVEISNTIFESLLNELTTRNVFPAFMVEDLREKPLSPREKKQKLFIDVQKRGPNAFNDLVSALCTIGSTDLALLLKTSSDALSDNTQPDVNSDNQGCDEVDATTERPVRNGLKGGDMVNSKDANECQQTRAQSLPDKYAMTFATVYNNGGNSKLCYRMISTPRGLALVINAINFPDKSENRLGASCDTENLRKLFKQLNFDATFVIDPTAEDLIGKGGAIDSFKERFSSELVDCSMVVVMSHGKGRYHIKTSDGQWVNFWDVIGDKFRNEKCIACCKKPKAFFVQACRGDSDNRVLENIPMSPDNRSQLPECKRLKADGSNKEEMEPLEGCQNMIIVNSTTPGYRAMRDEKSGTIFIKSMCKVFREHAHNSHLEKMINMINSDMAKEEDRDENGRKIQQNVHVEKMYPFHKLYFNPGFVTSEVNDNIGSVTSTENSV